MESVRLFEEYRLIERNESEVNGAWKGVHLLLFFMSFVFGSFCTFCFHMLMYLFDEKCVLYPKLQSLTSMKHNIIYEFIAPDKEAAEKLPLEFLSTQWMEKSACYVPTYVPLISGIFGLVWTTMFLMCSTGSRTLTGLQRPWRVLPLVFLFSLAMGGLCVYSSAITHYGLQELCLKLGEITGSTTCSYTVNVATLAYERRIRGVYQAIRLTVISAWLHTSCWLLSALLTLTRVLLVVDFQLVRVNVDLVGNIDKLLEDHEQQLCTVLPDVWFNADKESVRSFPMRSRVSSTSEITKKSQVNPKDNVGIDAKLHDVDFDSNDSLLFSQLFATNSKSEDSLLPEESHKLGKIKAYASVDLKHQFIVKILFDILESIKFPDSSTNLSEEDISNLNDTERIESMSRYRQKLIRSLTQHSKHLANTQKTALSVPEIQEVAREIRRNLQNELTRKLIALSSDATSSMPSTSKASKAEENVDFKSKLNITQERKKTMDPNLRLKAKSSSPGTSRISRKSNLKNIAIQTDASKKRLKDQKVHIADSTKKDTSLEESDAFTKDKSKETQTPKKEKQE